jgi:hypothetical protein
VLYCIVYCWTEEEGSNAVAAGVRAGGLQHAGGPRPSRNFAQAIPLGGSEPRTLLSSSAQVFGGEGGRAGVPGNGGVGRLPAP